MDEELEILELLRLVAKNGAVLRLENIYKGLPVAYDATILSIGPNYAELTCNKYQLACLYVRRETYMTGEGLEAPIYSQVAVLKPAAVRVLLTGFRFARQKIGMRDQIRVEPEEPVQVFIKLKNSLSAVQGLLADISVDGLGIYLNRAYFYPKLYQPGVEMSILLTLPGVIPGLQTTGALSNATGDLSSRFSREQIRGIGISMDNSDVGRRANAPSMAEPLNQINTRGRIMNIRPELHANRYRIGIKIAQDDRTRFSITQFISQRQSAIIREFKTLYEMLSKFQKV